MSFILQISIYLQVHLGVSYIWNFTVQSFCLPNTKSKPLLFRRTFPNSRRCFYLNVLSFYREIWVFTDDKPWPQLPLPPSPQSPPQPFLCTHACQLMLQWFHEDAIFQEICTAQHISESASLSSPHVAS